MVKLFKNGNISLLNHPKEFPSIAFDRRNQQQRIFQMDEDQQLLHQLDTFSQVQLFQFYNSKYELSDPLLKVESKF